MKMVESYFCVNKEAVVICVDVRIVYLCTEFGGNMQKDSDL